MIQRIIGFLLFIFLIAFPVYLGYELYLLDKVYFFFPVYSPNDDIQIRRDSYGNGDFLAKRNGDRKHNGIDLQADIGVPVYAVMGGKVLNATFHKGLGNYVEIEHRSGYVTVYGHLSKISIQENQWVRQAEKIGEVGKTGNADSPGLITHLHFEIRKEGIPLDPLEFLEYR